MVLSQTDSQNRRELCWSKVITNRRGETAEIPADWVDILREGCVDDNCWNIAIFAPSNTILRLIPVSSSVLYLLFELKELSDRFLVEIGMLFKTIGIKTLFSTGLCFTQGVCIYECYIDTSSVSSSIDQIKHKIISNVTGIKKITQKMYLIWSKEDSPILATK